MSQHIFDPKVHDEAIRTTCSNLLMARAIIPCEVAGCMVVLLQYSDVELARAMVGSRILCDEYLEHGLSMN